MKKRLAFILAGTITISILLSACGGTEKNAQESTATESTVAQTSVSQETEAKKEITLVATTNLVAEQATMLDDMLKAYTAENPNVKIEFSAPGKQYEDLLKVKMASNDMPDIFSTHGWAKLRYGNFVADLKDRTWAAKIDPAFKPIISDDNGKVYCLAFDQDKSGPIYNVEVFEKYGVQIPITMDELLAACETIKTKSNGEVTPIACAAEGWQEAQFFDFFATSLLISPSQNYQHNCWMVLLIGQNGIHWRKFGRICMQRDISIKTC